MFRNLNKIFVTAFYNFRLWRGNVRVIITFVLVFILCFLLTDRVAGYAAENGTTLQAVEVFILTFGDSNSILLSSILLLLLYADMPFITTATPYFLARASRRIWVWGQMLYIFLSTFLYLLFVLFATCLMCIKYAYPKNIWSHTVATLAYSGDSAELSVPVTAKILEMSRPYQVMFGIFGLMLVYVLVLVFVMLVFHLWRGQIAGVAAVLTFSAYGALLNPENIQKLLKLPDELSYKVRVWIGWVSPLNHATYSMHNFGYDNLPTLEQTRNIFLIILAVLLTLSLYRMRSYNFEFKGTEK